MGCAQWSREQTVSQPLNNPRIQVRPRHQLAALSLDEKEKERDRLIVRICQKRIDFTEGSSALSAHSEEVLRNVAEVFLEYPELNLVLQSHAGFCRNKASASKERDLARSRAEACRERLVQLGVLSDLILSMSEDGEDALAGTLQSASSSARSREPCVTFRAVKAKLLGPQDRLDYLLSRFGFDFIPRSADLSEKGVRVADAISRVIKETSNRVMILVPMMSSELALQRAEAIAIEIRKLSTTSEVSVEVASTIQKYATVKIEDVAPEGLGPQGELAEVLKATPLAFRVNSSEPVPEVLPAIRRCADILKQDSVQNMSVLIEAYSGVQQQGASIVAVTRQMMLRRAERIADWLQAEGVTIPLIPKGYDTTFQDDSLPESAKGVARVVLSLVGKAERELESLDGSDLKEAPCLGDRFNILGCM